MMAINELEVGLDFTVVEVGGYKEHVSAVELKSGEATCIVVTEMGVNIPILNDGTFLQKSNYLSGEAENYIELVCEDKEFSEFVVTTEGHDCLEEPKLNYLMENFFYANN